MTVTDQDIISRFPVGHFPLHPNVSLNGHLSGSCPNCAGNLSARPALLEKNPPSPRRVHAVTPCPSP
jgi:hypothetical protein